MYWTGDEAALSRPKETEAAIWGIQYIEKDDLELSPLASAYARARGSDRISSLRVVSAVNLAFSQSKLL